MRRALSLLWPAWALSACGSGAGGPGPDFAQVDCTMSGAPAMGSCSYPAGQVEPMQLGEVLSPYRWAEAINGAGERRALSLERVHCNDDPGVDWSRFGFLLFVSIPAW